MADPIDGLLKWLHITGASAKAIKVLFGILVVAISLVSYTPTNQFFPIFGVFFGGYLIIIGIQ